MATGVACLLFGAAAIWWYRGELVGAPEKSIAVLPFENLDRDQEGAAFTDLMRDDIVSQLTNIAELKITDGSSLHQYHRVTRRDLRPIANTLGVRNVLQGSVKRANERVDISVQLIDASTGKQLWAEHYDCDLSQALNIQNDVTKAIVNQLHARLSVTEKAALEIRTDAGEKSVELYRKSQGLASLPTVGDQGKENLFKRELLLNEATQLVSDCILAYRDLVQVETDLQGALNESGVKDSKQRHYALAQQALDNAERLEPGAAETRYIKFKFQYDVLHDCENARKEIDLALRGDPNALVLHIWAARCDRRLGRWEDCVADLANAYRINPSVAADTVARTYIRDLRRYAEAEQILNRALATEPESEWGLRYFRLAECRLAQGDPDGAKKFYAQTSADPDPLAWSPKITTALCLRDYNSALEVLASAPAAMHDSETIFDNAYCPHSWLGAQIARAQHGAEKAREAFATARKEAEVKWAVDADKPQQLSLLACMDAGAGRKEDAIREAKRALELRPIAKDACDGPYLAANLALVYAWTGERDLAIEQLEALAKIPGGPSYGDLKLNPKWDDLRGDPRFEQMVASLAPKL